MGYDPSPEGRRRFYQNRARMFYLKGYLIAIVATLLIVICAALANAQTKLDPRDYDTPQAAGVALRQACSSGNRTIELEPGICDVSAGLPGMPINWHIAKGTVLVGKGPGVTRLQSHASLVGDGCCFQLNDGVQIENLSLEGPLKDDPTFAAPHGLSHTCCVGWAGNKTYSGKMNARLRNVRVTGGNFQVYFWNPTTAGSRIIIERSEINGGRWLVCNGNSMGGDSGTIELHGCKLYGDYSKGWSDPADALGARIHGISARGGVTRMQGGLIDIIGSAEATDVRGAWIALPTSPPGKKPDYEGGAADTLIDLIDVHIRVRGNGAANVKSTEQGTGLIITNGGSQVAK